MVFILGVPPIYDESLVTHQIKLMYHIGKVMAIENEPNAMSFWLS
jgi:hypothetical protein